MVIATQTDISIENPTVQSLLSNLDLVQEWVNVHESILERWESKKFFGYQLFCQSVSYANVLT